MPFTIVRKTIALILYHSDKKPRIVRGFTKQFKFKAYAATMLTNLRFLGPLTSN